MRPLAANNNGLLVTASSRATVSTPPVVDQRHSLRPQVATLDVLCAVAAQAPLVFEFAKAILAVGAITIELAECDHAVLRIGHQYGVFPHLNDNTFY